MFWRLVKTAIFTAIAPLTVGILLPHWLQARFGVRDVFLGTPGLAAMYVFLAWGFVLYCWCAWDFVRRGEGTPAPVDAPRKLVVSGPYRYVRNPMYVAVLFLIASELAHYPSSARLPLFSRAFCSIPFVCGVLRGAAFAAGFRAGVRGLLPARPSLASAFEACGMTLPEQIG